MSFTIHLFVLMGNISLPVPTLQSFNTIDPPEIYVLSVCLAYPRKTFVFQSRQNDRDDGNSVMKVMTSVMTTTMAGFY